MNNVGIIRRGDNGCDSGQKSQTKSMGRLHSRCVISANLSVLTMKIVEVM